MSVERGEIAPFWPNHVNVKHKWDKEALFTIWSPFWGEVSCSVTVISDGDYISLKCKKCVIGV